MGALVLPDGCNRGATEAAAAAVAPPPCKMRRRNHELDDGDDDDSGGMEDMRIISNRHNGGSTCCGCPHVRRCAIILIVAIVAVAVPSAVWVARSGPSAGIHSKSPVRLASGEVMTRLGPHGDGRITVPALLGTYTAQPRYLVAWKDASWTLTLSYSGVYEVHIGFAATLDGPLTGEVVIGGWTNGAHTVVRSSELGPTTFVDQQVGLKAREGTITLSTSSFGVVTVKGGITGPLHFAMPNYDTQLAKAATYVTFSSWDGPVLLTGVSVQGGVVPDAVVQLAPPAPGMGAYLAPALFGKYDGQPRHQIEATPSQPWSFRFAYDGTCDVHVGIAATATGPILCEIAMGGWANTMSVVRPGPQAAASFSAGVGLAGPHGEITIDVVAGYILINGLTGPMKTALPNRDQFNGGSYFLTFTTWGAPVTYRVLSLQRW